MNFSSGHSGGMSVSYGRLTLPDDSDEPVVLDLRDSALEFAVCTRAAIARLSDVWCGTGTYLLVGGPDGDGRTRVYVGKASRLRERLKDHVKSKPWWNRAILLQSKSRDGFTTADAAWMEGEIVQRLLGWESVALENRTEPSDFSLSDHEVNWLSGVVDGLFRVFRLLGYYELSELPVSSLHDGGTAPSAWLIRAGTAGVRADAFLAHNEVRVGFDDTFAGDLTGVTVEDLRSQGGKGSSIGQLLRFRDHVRVGDFVLTPLPGSAVYLVGEVKGPYRHDVSASEYRHVRDVQWRGTVAAEAMTGELQRSLRSILTLFHPGDQAQLLELARGA